MNRRSFFKKTALTGVAAVSIPEIVKAAMTNTDSFEGTEKLRLNVGKVVLLQGDSITDCGRNRDEEDEPNKMSQLGYGYALFTAANLLANHAEKRLKIYNRGISGNKVFQLAERWKKDCIDLNPAIVSILIGVNDFWHTKGGEYKGTIVDYEADYRTLVARTQKELPMAKIVVCEPFIIHGGTALDDTWEASFAPYREAAKRIAKDYKTAFVPYQSVFNEALKKADAAYWGEDGVHPSMAGAQLMAQAWLKAVL